jgi:hypothetical protein
VESGGDVAIVAMEMTQNYPTLNTYYDGFGVGWFWGDGFGNATTTIDNYKVGTLVVDLFDANMTRFQTNPTGTSSLVIRGRRSRSINFPRREEMSAHIAMSPRSGSKAHITLKHEGEVHYEIFSTRYGTIPFLVPDTRGHTKRVRSDRRIRFAGTASG